MPPYATAQDVKDHLRISEPAVGEASQDTDDGVIELLVAGVSDMIDRVTGRTFGASAASDRSFDLPGCQNRTPANANSYTNFLTPYPVWASHDTELLFDTDCISVNSVTNGDGTVIDSANWRLLPYNSYPKYGLKLLNGASWNSVNDGLIVVNGVWGYSPSVPMAIQTACIVWAASEYRKRTGEGESAGFVTPQGLRILPSGMPKSVAVVLNSFIRQGISA